jgi:hypothetical protein
MDEEIVHLVFGLAEGADGDPKTGVITWRGCLAVKFGIPNDETQHGHPLWRERTEPPPYYGAVEVIGSPWIAELEAIEQVHVSSRPGLSGSHRHFVLLFHDSTFECVATGFEVSRSPRSPRAVVAELAARLAVDRREI